MLNKSLTVIDGGYDPEELANRKSELYQRFMAMLPEARIEYYTLREVERLTGMAIGLTKDNWKSYIESEIEKTMERLHNEITFHIEKLRGLL